MLLTYFLAENFSSNNMIKKPKTRRFPMVAGTWTGGEAQMQGTVDDFRY